MKKMKKSELSLVAIAFLSVIVAVGCGSGSDTALTQAQIDAARHPVADPNYKGPDPSAQQKIGENIEKFQKKHANDKVEFVR